MRFVGELEFHGISSILASVKISPNSESIPVRFIIDTGAANTVIGYKDVRKLGINYSCLEISDEKIIGVIGEITPYVIWNCEIILDDEDNDCKGYSTMLTKILVLPDDKSVINTPSLLGLDFLRDYKIRFNSLSVILEMP